MLLVKTTVKPSEIAGLGLFADQEIKKGDIIWKYTPETCSLLTQEQFQVLLGSFHKTEKDLIKYYLTYSYYQKSLNGAVLCLDNSRFVNHSDTPNMAGASHLAPNIAWQYSLALRDIKEGEELTENYASYDSADWLDNLCQAYEVFHVHSIVNRDVAVSSLETNGHAGRVRF